MHALDGMETATLTDTWKDRLWRQIGEIEDLFDRVALRLGDAIFGREGSEWLFGPHPSAF
jgi:hypothetical protein